jgi:hypothetical protein
MLSVAGRKARYSDGVSRTPGYEMVLLLTYTAERQLKGEHKPRKQNFFLVNPAPIPIRRPIDRLRSAVTFLPRLYYTYHAIHSN